jgi:hypothetical protein
MYEVSFIPILIAAVANVVIGMIWYNPHVFGGAWMRMTGITPEQAERGKRRMPLHVLLGFVASMLIAYVIAYFGMAWTGYLGINADWTTALQLAFWCWIGFVAPVLLSSVIWEQKPIRFYLINASYWLVSFMIMALVLLYVPMLFPAAPMPM